MSVIKSFCACPRLFIQDWGFVDHWPRVSKSFKKYPEFCFIKWWKGSQVLRKEFRLKVRTENSRPPYLLGTIFSSLPCISERFFLACDEELCLRLRPKAERKTRMKSLWNPGYQFIYSTVEEVCSMSLSALTFTSPSRRPVKVLEGAGSDHCWLAHFVIMPRIMTVRSR